MYPRSPSLPRSQRRCSRSVRVASAARGAALLVFALALEVRAAPPAGYYDSVDTTNPAMLALTLHEVIDDHLRFPYTSSATDTWDILELAQQDPSDAGQVLDVYRNAAYPKQGAGNVLYDREHTWPRSFGFPQDSSSNSVFSDAHMLHLADASYNGSRSNKPYGSCDTLCTLRATVANDGQGGGTDPYPGDDNWTTGAGGVGGSMGRWEVWNGRRGDIARALLYADLRYEGGVHGITANPEPDLVLTDDEALIAASNTGTNEAVAYMGLLSTLLTWHAQEPVDGFEQQRNDIVGAFQNNRNPFVDHPEWVNMLFAGEPCTNNIDCDDGVFCNGAELCDSGACIDTPPPCPASLVCDEVDQLCSEALAPGAVWINEIHYDNASADVGEFFEVAGPAGTDLGGWSLVGYNGANGDTYAQIGLSGLIPAQQGCGGTLSFDLAGMQNGSPDGLALIDSQGTLFEFISYEGSMTALAGPAAGESSVDTGVTESSATAVGQSLQRVGSGRSNDDFSWQAPAIASPGGPNVGQELEACTAQPVPTLPARFLFALGIALLAAGANLARRARAGVRSVPLPGS